MACPIGVLLTSSGERSYRPKLTCEEWISFGRYGSHSARRPLARVLARPPTRRAIPAAANAGRVAVNGGWY
jgi:hypothetical protein